jgi:ribosomal protein S18 acetylase RimI-like enzyme
MHAVRPFQSDEWRLYRELRLEALRDSPNAFASTLDREQAFPDELWMDRLARAATSRLDCPLVAEEAGGAVGLAWARIDADDPGTVTLYQLWVHPDARRRGIGRSLLSSATEWARRLGSTKMVLSVSCDAQPAVEFYRRLGFTEDGPPSPLRAGSETLQQPLQRSIVGSVPSAYLAH